MERGFCLDERAKSIWYDVGTGVGGLHGGRLYGNREYSSRT